MKAILIGFVIVFSLIVPGVLLAQASQDSLTIEETPKKVKKGSIFSGRPGKSMLMSLVVPGAGQIYNKSYLRVPFVWGAIGGVGYLMINNTRQYNCLRDAYIHRIDGTPYVPPSSCTRELRKNIPLITDPARIRILRDQVNTDRQVAIVGFALVWLLNGVDAFVDAHLKDFDIDEDLSIEIGTRFEDDPYAPMRMGVYVQF